jgi:hypothetical protein
MWLISNEIATMGQVICITNKEWQIIFNGYEPWKKKVMYHAPSVMNMGFSEISFATYLKELSNLHFKTERGNLKG